MYFFGISNLNATTHGITHPKNVHLKLLPAEITHWKTSFLGIEIFWLYSCNCGSLLFTLTSRGTRFEKRNEVTMTLIYLNSNLRWLTFTSPEMCLNAYTVLQKLVRLVKQYKKEIIAKTLKRSWWKVGQNLWFPPVI